MKYASPFSNLRISRIPALFQEGSSQHVECLERDTRCQRSSWTGPYNPLSTATPPMLPLRPRYDICT